jgi:UDP-glucose 4-epimerase
MEYRIARGGNPYGEGQDPNRGQGFISYGLAQLAQDKEIVIWGDGNVVRDFIYIGDFAEALVSMSDDSSPYRLYNVASGVGTSLNELLALFKSVTGIKPKVKYNTGRNADVPYNSLEITRIEKNLHWRPRTSLFDGARAWVWIQDQIPVKTLSS